VTEIGVYSRAGVVPEIPIAGTDHPGLTRNHRIAERRVPLFLDRGIRPLDGSRRGEIWKGVVDFTDCLPSNEDLVLDMIDDMLAKIGRRHG
jgi:hypothetical protein